MRQLNSFLCNDFIFSPRYRVWRHLIYWSFHTMIWAAFWVVMGAPSYGRQLFNQALWVPAFILFGYPLVYGAIPHLLLKGRVSLFFLVVLAWGDRGIIYRYRIQVIRLYSGTRGYGIGFHFTQGTVGLLLPVHDDFCRQPHDH